MRGISEEPVGEPGQIRPLVSIVMLTYNALDYTKECIESIRHHTSYPHELVLIDNASSDGTIEYLEQAVADNPHYRLITNQTNRGFAAGNNQGVAAARGDYVLLLNNDVLVSSGWLDDLVTALERDPQIGMVGPLTNHISGRQVIANIPYDDTAGFHTFAGQVRDANRGKLTPRRRIAGFALLIRKALFDELGGLEEMFGSGNYEDDDLCLRVRERGYAIMVDEGTYIHHYGSKTFKANGIDYQASLDHNAKLFRERWPEIDHDWLLEIEAPLKDVHKARLDEAANLINQGDLQTAEQSCRTVIGENPVTSQAYYGLGLIANLSGNFGEARQQFQAALTNDPGSAPTIKRIAEIDLINGDPVAAQGVMLPFVEQNQDDFEGRHLLARALLEQEMFTEAVSLLVSIINEEPGYWQAHLTMAQLYDELGQAEEVLKHAAAVLDNDPGISEAQQLIDKYNSS
jgi:GT2 family glycosyltransferase